MNWLLDRHSVGTSVLLLEESYAALWFRKSGDHDHPLVLVQLLIAADITHNCLKAKVYEDLGKEMMQHAFDGYNICM